MLRHISPRRERLLATLKLALCMASCALSTSVYATIQNTAAVTVSKSGGIIAPLNVIGDTVSGKLICPANPSAGCDFSNSDALVRTHDMMEYALSFNNIGSDTNIVVNATAPLGMVWDNLPAFCLAGSTVNNNPLPVAGGNAGVSVVSQMSCRLANMNNQAQSLPFRARVLGIPNATVLTPSFNIASTETPALVRQPPAVTVSAAPRFDVQIGINGTVVYGTYTDTQGNPIVGFSYGFYLRLVVDSTTGTTIGGAASTLGHVGAAPLDSTTLSTTGLLSDPANYPPGTALRSGSCPASGLAVYTGQPNSQFDGTNATAIARSVLTGSTMGFTCTQAGGPGTDIAFTWSNLNTTLNHIPTQSGQGVAIPAGLAYAATSRQFQIVVPISQIPFNANVLVKSCVSGFDPNGTGADSVPVSNFLADTEPGNGGTGNNCSP
jgi:hypothetical protein